jgi:hypothetical protein
VVGNGFLIALRYLNFLGNVGGTSMCWISLSLMGLLSAVMGLSEGREVGGVISDCCSHLRH